MDKVVVIFCFFGVLGAIVLSAEKLFDFSNLSFDNVAMIFGLFVCLAIVVRCAMEAFGLPNQEYWNKKRYIESNFKMWVKLAYENKFLISSDRQKYIDRIIGYMEYHKLQEILVNIEISFKREVVEMPILVKLTDETTYATVPPIVITRVNLIPQLAPQTGRF